MKSKIDIEVEELENIIKDLHHWARRYCDCRMTSVAYEFNKHTKRLIELGLELDNVDGSIYARDGMGRKFDGLTE